MTSRQRMRAALRREPVDRIPICDSLWPETAQGWRDQGHIPADADVNEFFGYEWRMVHFDSSFLLPETILEETESTITRRNAYGTVARYWRGLSAPAELLEFPINCRADWDALKDRKRWHPDRFALTGFYSFNSTWTPPEQDWSLKMDGLRRLRETDAYVLLYLYDAFEATWRKMGHEAALMALIDDPEWMREMFRAQIDLIIESYTEMERAGASVDGFFLASDLACKHGPLFSPAIYRDLCQPELKRLCDFLHSRDVDLIFHCDGDMRALLPNLLDAGIDCIQPLEVHAGLDVRELHPRCGDRVSFMGNIGVDEMMLPPDQLEALMAEKVNTAKRGGGYIYHSDHSVPPSVPFERYQHVLNLARKYGAY